MSTKQQLSDALDERLAECIDLREKLRVSQQETRRFQHDAQRAGDCVKSLERRMDHVRMIAESTLAVKHNVGTSTRVDCVRGEEVSLEKNSEEIRLLRHLHSITMADIPF